MRPEPITKAIEEAGSVKALAEIVGVTPQGVSQWKRVPQKHVRAIEALTGIPRHIIRDDVYDAPVEQATA